MLKPEIQQIANIPQLPRQYTKSKQRSQFSKKKQQEQQPDQHLMMAQEKQKRILSLWTATDKQLQEFFVNYQVYEGLEVNLKDLLSSNSMKLVKNQNRLYFGQVNNQKKQGFGICIYKDQKIYQGGFKDNQKCGLGYQIYPNGNVYIGQFQKNKKHGLGTFYWFTISAQVPSNHELTEYYQGQWWGGLPSGKGLHCRTNGDRYQGDFKNGLKHGEGFEIFFNGDTYKGQYVNGLPQGYGQYIWNDGSNFKGDFKQGVRNGFGIWKKNNKKNCEAYRGHYLLDRKSGYGVYLWETGEYYKGEFFQDVRQGYGQLYNQQKALYKGMWLDGKQMPNIPVSKSRMNYQRDQQTRFSKDNSPATYIQEFNPNNSQPKYFYKSSNQPKGIRYNTSAGKSISNTKYKSGKKNMRTLNTQKKKSKSPHHYLPETSKKKHKTLANQLNPEYLQRPYYGRIGHRNCIPVQSYGKPRKWDSQFNRK